MDERDRAMMNEKDRANTLLRNYVLDLEAKIKILEDEAEFYRSRLDQTDEFLRVSLKSLEKIMRPDKIMRQLVVRVTEIEKKLSKCSD